MPCFSAETLSLALTGRQLPTRSRETHCSLRDIARDTAFTEPTVHQMPNKSLFLRAETGKKTARAECRVSAPMP